MSGKYINRLPRGMPADQTRPLSDVFRDLHRDATQYQASGSGAIVRALAEKVHDLQIVPYDYGCTDGASADQAANFQKAINAAAAAGVAVDLLGLTWRVDSTITLASNLEIRNGTIDFSNATTGDVLFEVSGSTGTANNMTANRSRLSLSIPLTSAEGAAGDYYLVGSTANYESNTSTKVGEIVRVLSVSGSTLNLRDATHSAYNTADTANAKKLTFKSNIVLRNLRCIGGGNGTTAGGKDQYAGRFIVCRDVQVIDCQFEKFDYAALEFATCWNVSVRGGRFERAYDSTDGASYGVMFTQGTHHAKVEGASFYDTRHGVTTGGTTAVNRHITINGNTFIGCRAAAIDNHAGTELFAWTGNTISAEVGNLSSGTQAALQSLGGSGSITGNTIRGSYEHGILCQIFPLGIQAPLTIVGNTLEHGASADADHVGIFVEQRNNTTNSGIVIADNALNDGWQIGVMLEADGANITHFTISGNALGLVKNRGIYLNALTGKSIEHGTIAGNTSRVDVGGNENILLNSADAGGIEFVAVSGNQCYAGTYGIRGVNTDRIATVGNVAVGAGTANISVAGANSVSGNNVTS